MLDVVIVGAGPAGLSAALILGRFRRSVRVFDAGQPRNERSDGVHAFLSRDGIRPAELLQISREQLKPYTTVEIVEQEIVEAAREEGHFTIVTRDGETVQATALFFATGVRDVLPEIEGMADLWGRGVFHCPYCHGWEVRDSAIGIMANGAQAVHYSTLLYSLSRDLIICTNGSAEFETADREQLARGGIQIIETAISEVRRLDEAEIEIRFADGEVLRREALFVRPNQQQRSALPEKLGCALTSAGYVQVDEQGRTTVAGVYAAGDMTSPLQQVIHAASQGAFGAAILNSELSQEQFRMG